MKTAYLIYPYSENDTRTPFIIGYRLSKVLIELGYDVVVKPWNLVGSVKAENDQDIIIGHAHPNPLTIFRRSVQSGGWHKRILCQPFNADMGQLGYLRSVVKHVDGFLAICGKGWHHMLPKVGLHIEERTHFIDLAIDTTSFSRLETSGDSRKIIYIGNADKCKNTDVVRKMEAAGLPVAAMGADIGVKNYLGYHSLSTENARRILADFRFLVVPSLNDANPTVVLEAMSLGLIPVISHSCGFVQEDGPIVISSHTAQPWIDKLSDLLRLDNKELDSISKKNFKQVYEKFHWDRFHADVKSAVMKTSKLQDYYPIGDMKLLAQEILGSRFYLRPGMIRELIWSESF